MSQRSVNDINQRIEAKHLEIFRNFIRLTEYREQRDLWSISNLEKDQQRLWEELAILEREERDAVSRPQGEGEMGSNTQDLRDHTGTIR